MFLTFDISIEQIVNGQLNDDTSRYAFCLSFLDTKVFVTLLSLGMFRVNKSDLDLDAFVLDEIVPVR